MPRTSALGRAEDALYALLVARREVSGTWVSSNTVGAKVGLDLGHPGDGIRDEHVWIEEDSEATQAWASTMGTDGQKQETTTVLVGILSALPQHGYADNRDRALELAGEVELAIRESFTLGDEAFQAEVVRLRKLAAIADTGRPVQIQVEVSVMSLLS